MRTFANIPSRYRLAVLAALISVSVACLFARPDIAYAAGVDDETKFVFDAGSQLALGSAADVVAMSNVMVNTNLAAAAGVLAALAVSRPILGRMDLIAGLNGAIAGLVSVTAAPDLVDHH